MLVLPEPVRDELVDRAREGAPAEVCGVLGGRFGRKREGDRSRVVSQHPAENVADRPETRYRIDPEEQLEIFERLEGRGEEIVGFYHSHPNGPARPSETDAADATWPDRSYAIISLAPFEVGSWRWRTGDGKGGDGSEVGDGSENGDRSEDGDESEGDGRFVREELRVE